MGSDIEDFRELRPMPAFVDKTLLIKAIITNSNSRFLITAPRKFGKSVNLSMIKRFFEICENTEDQKENRRLFENLLIAKEKIIMDDHFGKFPVIFLYLRPKTGSTKSFGEALSAICTAVRGAYEEHRYLAKSDKLTASEKKRFHEEYDLNLEGKEDIADALTKLAYCLKKHWKNKVTVLVDEYDAICSNSFLQVEDIPQLTKGRLHRKATKEIEEIIHLSQAVVSCLLKGNADVGRGIVTGISYLTSKGLSNINTLEVIKFQEDSEFAQYYGLTLDECKNLLTKFNLNSHIEEVKQYYDGYRNNMFSTFSIIQYVEKKKLDNFWTKSGSVEGFDSVLKIPSTASRIFELLDNPSKEMEIIYYSTVGIEEVVELKNILDATDVNDKVIDIYFNFLLEQGYLKITHLPKDEEIIKVKIPNREIEIHLSKKLKAFVKSKTLNLAEARLCAVLFNEISTSDKNNTNLLKKIKDKLNVFFSKIDFYVQNESIFHHIMYNIVGQTGEFIFFSEIVVSSSKSNRLDLKTSSKSNKLDLKTSSKSNRLDLMMIHPKSNIGIIIELKFKKTAEEALQQIISKEYWDAFTNPKYNKEKVDVKYEILIGLNMATNKTVTMCALFNSRKMKDYVNIMNN